MAIIRIKRTTGTDLPVGLTFGELAFIGRTGGATANRLYINDAQGNMRWIGAEILNSPASWTGSTAETTIPTVHAVKTLVDLVSGDSTFDSDIFVNIGTLPNGQSKTFGKYVDGETIPANDKTAAQVIIDALTAYLLLGATASVPNNNTSFTPMPLVSGSPTGLFHSGVSGSISWGVTWGYIINSPGYTAVGATLQVSRDNSSWTSLGLSPNGTLYDTTGNWSKLDGSGNVRGFTFGKVTYTTTHTAYDTTPYYFRYIVNDAGGTATSSPSAQVSPQTFVNPQITSQTVSVLNSTNLVGINHQQDTGLLREHGNTASQVVVNYAIGNNMSGTFHKFRQHGFQWTNLPGTSPSTWYSITNGTNAIVNNDITTPTATPGNLTYAWTPHISGVTYMAVRYRVAYDGAASPIFNGYTFGTQTSQIISLRKRIFYGATNGVPTSPSHVRSLPFSILGPTTGQQINAKPSSDSSTGINSFTFPSSTNPDYTTYVVALPKGLTLNSQATDVTWREGILVPGVETIFGNSNPQADQANALTSPNTVPDYSGIAQNYTIYTWSVGSQYSSRTFEVNFNGKIDP